MDPNEILQQLRVLLQGHRYGEPFSAHHSDQVRDLFAALDEWLTRGGFLPDAWRQHEPADRDGVPS